MEGLQVCFMGWTALSLTMLTRPDYASMWYASYEYWTKPPPSLPANLLETCFTV